MLEEYQKKVVKAFNGLYVNGTPEEVPADHFVDSRNNSFRKGMFSIRPGSSLRYDIGQEIDDYAEWVTGTFPAPILSIDSSGNFRLNNSDTVLWQAVGATDFFCVNFYSRLFISPCNSDGPVGNLLMLYYPPSDVSITAVTTDDDNATYTYTLVSGPALQIGQSITIAGMTNNGNNTTANITALATDTFTIVNATAVDETDTVQTAGTGSGVNSNNPTIRECGGLPPSGTPMVAANGAAQTFTTGNTTANPCTAQTQVGSGSEWSNLSNVTVDDGNYATVALTPTGATNTSNALVLTGFGFNVPATDTIVGVQVIVHRQQISGSSAARDSNVSLVGVTDSNNYYDPNSWVGNQYYTYGGDSDTWGLSTYLTPDVVNADTFGVSITIDCTAFPGNGCVAGIDYVSIEVFYASQVTGFVAEGTYQIGVVYETDTGFLTPPAPATVAPTQTTVNAPAYVQFGILYAGVTVDPSGTFPIPGNNGTPTPLDNTPTVGNTLIFMISMQGAATLTAPAGLTAIGNYVNVAAGQQNLTIFVYTRVVQEGDTATYWEFTVADGNEYSFFEGCVVEIEGNQPIQWSYGPLDVTSDTAAQTPAIGPYTDVTIVSWETADSTPTESWEPLHIVSPTPASTLSNGDYQSGSVNIWSQVNTFTSNVPLYYSNAGTGGNISSNAVYAMAVIPTQVVNTSNIVPVQFTADGNHAISLTNIPTGPEYTIARYIIITLPNETEPYYFVPQEDGGVLNDNVTTSTQLDFFVTDLVESADYLFNIRARIPSSQGINVYSARLILWGMLYPDDSILRCSNSGDPETFDQTVETVVISRDDGYFVSNTAILRDILYIWKNAKGIFATSDNGSDPVDWDVEIIDQSVGCSSFRGISTSSASVENSSNSELLGFSDVSGIYLFNGMVQQPALTWKIQDLWASGSDFSQISIIVDIVNKRIHITGFDASSDIYNMSLVGDFNDGIDAVHIKWDIWTYHNNARLLDNVTGTNTQVCTLLTNGNIITFDNTQYVDYIDGESTSAITQYAKLGAQEFEVSGVNIFIALIVKALGIGSLITTLYSEDALTSYSAANTALSTTPGQEYLIRLNFYSERCYVEFSNSSDTNAYFEMSREVLYGTLFLPERPQ